MSTVKIILRSLAGVLLLGWLGFFIAGRTETAATLLLIALFAVCCIIGIQLSTAYHSYFVKRRRG